MLAGREEPLLGLARLRAERRLAELGRDELAFDAVEARGLLHAAGVDLTGPEVAELTRRTEGWAAGLYLSALSLRDGGSLDREAVSAVVSQNGHIADYLRSEVLSYMAPEQVEFLTRTAVLEWMCGPLCDAILEQTGTAAMLETLERSNRFVVPLDGGGEWYRYHHLFRTLLAHELEHREPGLIPTLSRRAAAWVRAERRTGNGDRVCLRGRRLRACGEAGDGLCGGGLREWTARDSTRMDRAVR